MVMCTQCSLTHLQSPRVQIIPHATLTHTCDQPNRHGHATTARFCYDVGLHLRKVEVIPDDMAAIGDAIRHLSSNYDYVFTSGGLGVCCARTHACLFPPVFSHAHILIEPMESAHIHASADDMKTMLASNLGNSPAARP